MCILRISTFELCHWLKSNMVIPFGVPIFRGWSKVWLHIVVVEPIAETRLKSYHPRAIATPFISSSAQRCFGCGSNAESDEFALSARVFTLHASWFALPPARWDFIQCQVTFGCWCVVNNDVAGYATGWCAGSPVLAAKLIERTSLWMREVFGVVVTTPLYVHVWCA
jgi:hypothetical protein